MSFPHRLDWALPRLSGLTALQTVVFPEGGLAAGENTRCPVPLPRTVSGHRTCGDKGKHVVLRLLMCPMDTRSVIKAGRKHVYINPLPIATMPVDVG